MSDHRIESARREAERMVRYLAERVASGDCARAVLYVEEAIDTAAHASRATRSAEVLAEKADGNGDAYRFDGSLEALITSFERRVLPSTIAPEFSSSRELLRLRVEMRAPKSDASAFGHALGERGAWLEALRAKVEERVAKSPCPGVRRTDVMVRFATRWRFYSDLEVPLERTDTDLLVGIVHHVDVEAMPTRVYGDDLTRADLEDSLTTQRAFHHEPRDADLDALVLASRQRLP